jgi:hypothetical protein
MYFSVCGAKEKKEKRERERERESQAVLIDRQIYKQTESNHEYSFSDLPFRFGLHESYVLTAETISI